MPYWTTPLVATTLPSLKPTSARTSGNMFVMTRVKIQQQMKIFISLCNAVLPGGLTVYRHNRTKTINWLRKKVYYCSCEEFLQFAGCLISQVESLAAQLEAQQVHVGPGSHSSTLVRSRKHDSVTKGKRKVILICTK